MRTRSGHHSKSYQNVKCWNGVLKYLIALLWNCSFKIRFPHIELCTKHFCSHWAETCLYFSAAHHYIDVNVAISLSISIIIVRRLGNEAFAFGIERWTGFERLRQQTGEEGGDGKNMNWKRKKRSQSRVCWFFPVSRVIFWKYKLKNGSAHGMALFTETFEFMNDWGRKTNGRREKKWCR